MTQAEQLERWVAGDPVHLDATCVPDFSCCTPGLLADEAVRHAFAQAHATHDVVACLRFLTMFINAALASEGQTVRVRVVGDGESS